VRTIEWKVSVGVAGCEQEGTIEVDDDATEEDIDAAVSDDMFNVVSWSWKEKGK
jgi:hypothetical protein